MRQKRNRSNKSKAACILFGGAVICLCFLSTKLMLILLAIALIAAGIWLMRC